uniref:Microsomal triglyceride transfer protein large subunit-like n=1 Tax=Callorhinchus milii TaxID=7868 RepID=A0A4W3H298_CALMI
MQVLLLFFFLAQDVSPAFKAGALFKYKYTVDLLFETASNPGTQPGSGFRIDAIVQLHVVWKNSSNEQDQLIQLQVSVEAVQLLNVSERQESQNIFRQTQVEALLGPTNAAALKRPVIFHWNSGKVISFINFTTITPLTFFAHKVYTNTGPKAGDLQKNIALLAKLASVLTAGQQEVTCLSKLDGIIKSAVTEENHVVSLNLQSTIGAKISSRLAKFHCLQEALQDLGNYISFSVSSDPEETACNECPSVSARSTYQPLLCPFLCCWSWRIREVEKRMKSSDHCVLFSSPFLIDSLTAAQTKACLAALSEYLDFTKKTQTTMLEKFLYASALSSRPSEELLRTLLDKFNGKIANREIRETTALAIGAVIGKMCRVGLCKLQVSSCLNVPDQEADTKMYLLALKNALLPETIPLLLRYADQLSGSVTAIAVAALQRFPSVYITPEVKQHMNRIFHQNRNVYDIAVRAAAADVILNSAPSVMEVKNLLLSTGEVEPELSKYLLAKLQNILRSDRPVRKIISEALRDQVVYNYHRLSRTGRSSSCSGYLAVTRDMISSYSMDLLFGETGVLRKSNSDFFIFSQGSHLHATQVSIEAQGLDSFLEESSKEAKDDVVPMAEMSVILFDVQLRPVVFFQGYDDLMEKVWAVTEEPTNVISGSILLIDHLQAILLQSGLQASAEFQGGLGIDISGNIELSFWSQESKTRIRNRGSLVVNSVIQMDTSFIQAGISTISEAEAALDFVTTVKFLNSPILICLQLKKEPFEYRETVTVYESLKKGRDFHFRKGRTVTIQGTEVPLHRANSDMCKETPGETPFSFHTKPSW